MDNIQVVSSVALLGALEQVAESNEEEGKKFKSLHRQAEPDTNERIGYALAADRAVDAARLCRQLIDALNGHGITQTWMDRDG